MRRPCFILLVCALLTFCVSVLVPAQDVAETTYDESEGLFYESTPLFTTVLEGTLQIVPKSRSTFHLGTPTRLSEGSENRIGSAFRICDSLAFLQHLLRC